MARHEADREDLIRDATALVRRAEWLTISGAESLVAGFRRDGSLSLYFGADPVYHFDSAGRLKRAYGSGLLYRTQGATLAELARERSAMETKLMRRDLGEQELADFLVKMTKRIDEWRKDWNDRRIIISRMVPINDTELENDLAMALEEILTNAAKKCLAPRFPGKR